MIHYHGTPITPATSAQKVLAGRHGFVSYARPDQLEIAVEACQSFAIDNGAFSAWVKGAAITDWSGYYAFAESCRRIPSCDFAVIPDVIGGSEADNDSLLAEWPMPVWFGAPVWHMHLSIDRLVRLAADWPRVCIGSSGEYATVGDARWWKRMTDAMNAITDSDGLPHCKLHGLRMLDPDVFAHVPFASADSTNIAQNIGIDSKWRGTYQPPDKDWRALMLAARIESTNAATRWHKQMEQTWLF
jgi:hypothetical protein